jgi:hypothetical protein
MRFRRNTPTQKRRAQTQNRRGRIEVPRPVNLLLTISPNDRPISFSPDGREDVMGDLTFVCPRTGRPIDSGIETDPDTMRMVRAVSLRVACAHCGEAHAFQVADGYLDLAA